MFLDALSAFFTFHGGAILQPNPLDSCYVKRVNAHVQSKDFVYFTDRNFYHCPVPEMAIKSIQFQQNERFLPLSD